MPLTTCSEKDQAIFIHAKNSLKLYDNARDIGDIVEPKTITFASRISNNRICIYLTSSNLVDQLIKSHPMIRIGDMSFSIRRLISSTKRIIISNIPPFILHETAENAIKSIGLQITSPFSFLKAAIYNEYSHILSFRRQVFIHAPSDNHELQTSIMHEEKKDTTQESTGMDQIISISQLGEPSLTQAPGQKRLYSDTLSTSDQLSSLEENFPISPFSNYTMPPPTFPSTRVVKKATKKKRKTETSVGQGLSEDTQQRIAEAYQETPHLSILPIDNFVAFIENTHGRS
ncbi:hypothetical protein HHI36_001775 [Cryptolaemus montrouzieri]|uniref:Uncharacterized protein n=1 Tax=Cryptolaemus montrouzieri TaxID=559131 RepID=A0ABD2P9X7_9CUCU